MSSEANAVGLCLLAPLWDLVFHVIGIRTNEIEYFCRVPTIWQMPLNLIGPNVHHMQAQTPQEVSEATVNQQYNAQ